MFRWLKKKCNRPSSPRFSRYYTSRNSWSSEDDYICETIPPLQLPDVETIHEDGYDVISEDHIYEDIDDVIITSAIDQLTEAITGLTSQLERDFGDGAVETETEKPKDEPIYSQVIKKKKSEHQVTENQENIPHDGRNDNEVYTDVRKNSGDVSENRDPTMSPRSRNSREKCRAWLKQQEGQYWTEPTEDRQIVWSSQEDVTLPKSKRLSRQSSMADRRAMLKRIRDTWFDSSDDSSDTSDHNRSFDWSSCSSENCKVIQYQRVSYMEAASSGEDTSGFYDDSNSSPKSILSSDNMYSESSQSPLSSTSGDSLFTKRYKSKTVSAKNNDEDVYLFNPRIGFGLNRWYKP